MSDIQYAEAVERKPLPAALIGQDSIHRHFVYDFPLLFRKQFPTAEPLGIAVLPYYEFHVNETGRANIRPIFNTKFEGREPVGKEYLLPVPGIKGELFDIGHSHRVYGIVFNVSKEDNEIIERSYKQQNQPRSRVICDALECRKGGFDNGNAVVAEVSAFADLLHTCDGHKSGASTSPTEIQRWVETLILFQRHGVPTAYRAMVIHEVHGMGRTKISPIYVDPEAYPEEITRHLRNKQEPEKKVVKDLLPPKAAILKKQYFKKHGALALPPPRDDEQARIFEEYHDEVMRGQVDIDFDSSDHLKATVGYWNKMSDRTDDGLDFLDAIKESRGERPWKHPNTVRGPPEVEDKDEDKAIAAQPKKPATKPKAGPKAGNMRPPPKRKQAPQSMQAPPPNGPSPAKKQKVQRPSTAAAPKAPKNSPSQRASAAAAPKGPKDSAMQRPGAAADAKGPMQFEMQRPSAVTVPQASNSPSMFRRTEEEFRANPARKG